jgi:hypothetical protein
MSLFFYLFYQFNILLKSSSMSIVIDNSELAHRITLEDINQAYRNILIKSFLSSDSRHTNQDLYYNAFPYVVEVKNLTNKNIIAQIFIEHNKYLYIRLKPKETNFVNLHMKDIIKIKTFNLTSKTSHILEGSKQMEISKKISAYKYDNFKNSGQNNRHMNKFKTNEYNHTFSTSTSIIDNRLDITKYSSLENKLLLLSDKNNILLRKLKYYRVIFDKIKYIKSKKTEIIKTINMNNINKSIIEIEKNSTSNYMLNNSVIIDIIGLITVCIIIRIIVAFNIL